MKILLINTNRFKEPYPLIPIGLCYVASVLDKNNYDVCILDLCFVLDTYSTIKNKIKEYNPDIIGITIRNIDNSSGFKNDFLINDVKYNIVDNIKKYFSGYIVVGGAAVGINSEEILDFLGLEYAIIGDGEFAFLEFVNRINEGKDLNVLSGLVIRKNGITIKKNPPFYLDNLNDVPFARPYKYIDLSLYKLYNTNFQVQTKRGCPMKCSYCTYNKIEGKHYRYRSPKIIADEIADFVENTDIKNIEIVDSVFNISFDHSKNVLRAIKDKNLKFNLFSVGLNPKFLDDEFCDLIRESGVSDISIGVESCNDYVLERLGKNYKKEDIYKAGKYVKKMGIKSTIWFLLLGAEGESYSSIMETFKVISDVSRIGDAVFLGVGLRVYNGSPISLKVLSDNNCATKDDFFSPYGYIPKDISLEAIKAMSTIAFFKYHNFFMYDEGARVPLLFRVLFKLFFPHKPLWKMLIYTKLFLKITGVSYFISKLLELRYYKLLKKYRSTM